MADVRHEIRISELPVASTVNGDDKLEATQGDVTRSVTVGQVASQVGVQLDLSTYAKLDSPTFTGNPKAPTPVTSDNDTSIATTAFVQANLAALPPTTPTGPAGGDLAGSYPNPTLKANIALTGNPTAPTPSPGDNDTSIATTGFVTAAISAIPPLATTSADLRAQITDETGTGALVFANGALGDPTATTMRTADATAALPAYTFAADTTMGMYRITSAQLGFASNGRTGLSIGTTGTSLNYVTVFSNNTPTVSAVHASAGNIALQVSGAGTGGVDLMQGSGGAYLARFTGTTSAVNYVSIANAVAGAMPAISVAGTDTDPDLLISAKGNGRLRFNNAGSFTANGSVATTMTSLGPTGASATVRKWLTIKDNGGVVGYIPVY